MKLTLGLFDGAFLAGGIYDFRQGPFASLDVPGNPTGSFDFDRMGGATRVANNRAHQLSGVVQYHLSKRTFLYAEGIHQHASGDEPMTQAWINALNQPGSASPTGSQVLARVGVSTRF